MPYDTTTQELEQLFASCGSVDSVNIISDRFSGKSKGFGFVEMHTEEEARKAIETLNGATLKDRAIAVSEARPMEKRDDNRGGYQGGGGGQRGGFSRSKRW